MQQPPPASCCPRLPPSFLLAITPLGAAPLAKPTTLCAAPLLSFSDVTMTSVIPGKVDQVPAQEGDIVKAGQVLIQLDSRLQAASVAVAKLEADDRSAEAVAQAKLTVAKLEKEAQERLFSEKSATDRDVKRAQAEFEGATAELEQARAHHEQAVAKLQVEQVKLDQHTLVAPFAGVVSKVQATPGQVVGADTQLIRIVALNPLKAEIHLPGQAQFTMKVGQSFKLKFDAPINREVLGKLIALDAVVDGATATRRGSFEIQNPEGIPAGYGITLVSAAPVAAP